MKMKMKKFTEESGLSRPVEGAVIGFLLFTFLFVLFWWISPLGELILLPGHWIQAEILFSLPNDFGNSLNSLSESAFNILFYGISFVISAAPPTISGAMINSKGKTIRRFGIIFLLVYLILLILLPFMLALSLAASL
jgi:hypothetical protein